MDFNNITKKHNKTFKEMVDKELVDISKIKEIEKKENVEIGMISLVIKIVYYKLDDKKYYATGIK